MSMSSDHLGIQGMQGTQTVAGPNDFQSKAAKSNGRSIRKISSQDIRSGTKAFLKTAAKIVLAAAVITFALAVVAGAVALPVAGVVLVAVALGVIAKTKSCAKRTILQQKNESESKPKLNDQSKIHEQSKTGLKEQDLFEKYEYTSEKKLLKNVKNYLRELEYENEDGPFHKNLPQFYNDMVELRKQILKNDPDSSAISESYWKKRAHRRYDFGNNLVAYTYELRHYANILEKGVQNQKLEAEKQRAEDETIRSSAKSKADQLQAEIKFKEKELEEFDK